MLHAIARGGGDNAARTFEFNAGLAETYPFEEPFPETKTVILDGRPAGYEPPAN